MPWKKPKKRPEPGSLAPIRTIRPPKGGLAQALDDVNATRPEHVPDDATLLVSWVSLPGENTQRGHWAKQKVWKDALKADFGACLELQGYPPMYENPAVHIAMRVTRKGDDNNRLARAKYVIDLLQEHKTRADGQRVQGLLNLIKNDDVLNNENRTIEESTAKVSRPGGADKYGREKREADHMVAVWVWERDAAS